MGREFHGLDTIACGYLSQLDTRLVLYERFDWNTVWQIPGNNSKSNGFSSSIASILWGIDPTGGGSTPSVGSLTTGTNYNWQIQVQDSNGNSTVQQVSYPQ